MIRLEGVHRVFRVGDQEVHALAGVDLRIEPGEHVSIMGPSGSGKSTLLNLLGLLDTPTSGRYLLEGEDVSLLEERDQARLRRERIGFVFQFFHLVPRLSALENVELPLALAGAPVGERRERARLLLLEFGLGNRLDHRPDQLSGGQRQRVAIARAMAGRPALLLADEPTGNLDRAAGLEVLEILERLHARGLTLVVVTHDPAIGARAPRCVRMVDGRVIADEASSPASPLPPAASSSERVTP